MARLSARKSDMNGPAAYRIPGHGRRLVLPSPFAVHTFTTPPEQPRESRLHEPLAQSAGFKVVWFAYPELAGYTLHHKAWLMFALSFHPAEIRRRPIWNTDGDPGRGRTHPYHHAAAANVFP